MLIHPPDFSRDSRNGPPLGLCYLASYLQAHGHSTRVVDWNANSRETEVRRHLLARDPLESLLGDLLPNEAAPGVVGVSATALHVDEILHLGVALRETFPESALVAGGYCSLAWRRFLDPDGVFDFVVLGEGETTLLELVDALEAGRDPHDLPGLASRAGGTIHRGSVRTLLPDLDALPFPDFSSVDLTDYGYEQTGWLYCQRGCPNACTFCDVATFYGTRHIRSMSPDKVVEWIGRLHDEHGCKRVQFVDDNFLNRRGWLPAICRGLEARGTPVQLNFQTRVTDVIRLEEDLTACRACIYQVELGIESFSQAQLDRWAKNTTVAQNARALEILHALGLPHACYFILADPHTTLDEIAETFRGIREAPPVPVSPGGPALPAAVAHYDFNVLLDLHGNVTIRGIPHLEAVERFLSATEDACRRLHVVCLAMLRVGHEHEQGSRGGMLGAKAGAGTGTGTPWSKPAGDLGATLFHGFIELATRLAIRRLQDALTLGTTVVAKPRGLRATRVEKKLTRAFTTDARDLLESITRLGGFDRSLLD